MKKIFGLFLIAALVSSCETNSSEEVASQNAVISADNYIALGDANSAGYMNGGLYRKGQEVSFPSLLAKQLNVKFEQPLFALGQENGTGYLTKVGQEIVSVKNNTAFVNATSLAKYEGNNNNLGIPFLRMSEVAVDYSKSLQLGSKYYPFFERISTNSASKTYLDLVNEAKPTFYTLFLGEQDVLAYATNGGLATTTEISVFSINLRKLLDALVTAKAQGIVANIPDITTFPMLTNFENAKKKLGISSFYILTGNGITRKATSQDFLLTASLKDIIAAGGGATDKTPLKNEWVLDQAEVQMIQTLIRDYNDVLKKETTSRNIPMVDLKTLINEVVIGKNSTTVNQFFSLDNVYPTPRGYALIANEYIKVINQQYKTSYPSGVPLIDVNQYGVE